MARHTAGQSVLDHTGNLNPVQNLLGHSSITTTDDIYTDWDIDQLEETMRFVVGEDERPATICKFVPAKALRNSCKSGVSAPGRNRTCDLALRRRALYPLSYRRRRPQSSGASIVS
jgi:hypothetical protein